ncbi:MAG: ABC transporter permease [Lachnospiraceae bacterium]|nr:ABC transporter permease [Lachnospiraceae bacterium]
MKSVAADLSLVFTKRRLIWELARADFKKKFVGSYFGILWMFVQPVVTVVIYYIVFGVLRGDITPQTDNYPYLLWMLAGIVPWFFFQEALNGGTHSLNEYNYLVKKVVFPINILAAIKMVSAFFIHLIFLLILLAVFLIMGRTPTIYWLQLPYFSAGVFVLCLGLSYMTSAVMVFFRDMGQIVNIILQFGIWVTPIMWQYEMAGSLVWLLKLNPMFYVAEGMRGALLYNCWFWEQPGYTLYFWAFSLGVLVLGAWMFGRLRPHFADVL